MGKQYAISISDIMSTYTYKTTQSQDKAFIEIVTGTINAEIERTGSKYIDTIYVNDRPSILLFEQREPKASKKA